MKFSKWMGPLTLCAGCSFAGLAQAADDGWYVVAFGGEASAQNVSQSAQDQQLVDLFGLVGLTPVDVTSALDDSDTGFGLAAGYQVNEHFAAELGYVDLGDISYQAAGTVTDGFSNFVSDFALSQNASGPVFSFLGILPIGDRFSVFGRVGLALMDVEADANVTIDGVATASDAETNRSNGVYGIGGEFSLSDSFGIRIEWDRYAGVGSDGILGDVDIDLISLGLRYNFR